VTAFHETCNETGGHGVTLHLAPDVIADASADPRGFLSHVRRRLEGSFTRTFGRSVGFWLVVETTPGGRPHLHGGVAVTDNELPQLEAALRHAAGTWGKRKGSEYQVLIRAEPDPSWWPGYATKRLGRTAKIIPGPLVTATNCIRSRQKSFMIPGGRHCNGTAGRC